MADSAPAKAEKLQDLAADKGMVNVQVDGAWIQVRPERMIEVCKQAEEVRTTATTQALITGQLPDVPRPDRMPNRPTQRITPI